MVWCVSVVGPALAIFVAYAVVLHFSLILALLFDIARPRFRTEEELVAAFGIPVLVAVPRMLETLKDKLERDFEAAGQLDWFRRRFDAADVLPERDGGIESVTLGSFLGRGRRLFLFRRRRRVHAVAAAALRDAARVERVPFAGERRDGNHRAPVAAPLLQ